MRRRPSETPSTSRAAYRSRPASTAHRAATYTERQGRGVLEEELKNYRLKQNLATGCAGFEPLREGHHDDLLFATCLGGGVGACHPQGGVHLLPWRVHRRSTH